jgi:SAM-dependent methyltransferase
MLELIRKQTLTPDVERVRKHFEGKAEKYSQSSNGLLWRNLRQSESDACLEMLGDIQNLEILELGCGAGYYTELLLGEGARHLWAVDFSLLMLDQIPDFGVTKICDDASSVNLGRSFPIVFSAGLLEFLAEPEVALSNMAQHLATGGRAVVLYPLQGVFGSLYRAYHSLHGVKLKTFSVTDFEKTASNAGLHVDRTSRCGLFSAVSSLQRLS